LKAKPPKSPQKPPNPPEAGRKPPTRLRRGVYAFSLIPPLGVRGLGF